MAVLMSALAARPLPRLGIAGCAQLLLFSLRGNLFQELKSHRKHDPNRWTILPLKMLKVQADSRLWRLLMCRRTVPHQTACTIRPSTAVG